MKILVVGSGGREHAIVSTLGRSPRKPQLYAAPGNAGIGLEAQLLDGSPDSLEGIERLLSHARSQGIGLTVVGPEAPLVLGMVDRFQAERLKIFGPDKSAAQLEGSKCFAKEFLARHGIPTGSFRIFDDPARARRHVESCPLPVVLKADGLAAGKGVIVARERAEALAAVEAILVERRFGEAGKRLVVEEFLEGSELSFFVISDGETFVPLETAQDYKQVFDGDQGPNTGGMGSYSPYYDLEDPLIRGIVEDIVKPTLKGLRSEGIVFRGSLYIGLMLTSKGPQVLEFNVRLGDPETQVILSRLRTDLAEVLERAADGRLAGLELSWDPRHAVTIVAASDGYPGKYTTGEVISGLDSIADEAVKVFHSGTRRGPKGEFLTAGGRVLAVTALGKDRSEARARAYAAIPKIHFAGMHHRKDIGAPGR